MKLKFLVLLTLVFSINNSYAECQNKNILIDKGFSKQEIDIYQKKYCQKSEKRQWKTIGHYQVKDGLVRDTRTKLMWMRCSIGQHWNGSLCQSEKYGTPLRKMDWWNAKTIAKNAQKQGYSDWRLPTKKELLSLVYCSSGLPKKWNNLGRNCQGNFKRPTIQQQVFPNTANYYYWSTPHIHNKNKKSWKLHFLHGGNYDSNHNKVYNFHLRLVRGG